MSPSPGSTKQSPVGSVSKPLKQQAVGRPVIKEFYDDRNDHKLK